MSGLAAAWTPFLRPEYKLVTAERFQVAACDTRPMFQGMLESGLKSRMGAAV